MSDPGKKTLGAAGSETRSEGGGIGSGTDHGIPGGAGPKMECGVCWQVYDPELGDEVWQIPPGTPFAALPPHWSCPHCSAQQERFLVLTE
ncbi:rubredoxin [Rhodocyclus tenuis]|uniref:rubredoxin n=1 Tax=Rhodocyclus tenuis TaxID=1066 RepID=UPI001A92A90A|nr:rubredoxin [Rhodocyclus tenuis]